MTEQRDKQVARAVEDAVKKDNDSIGIDTVAMLIGMYRLEIRAAVLKEAAERLYVEVMDGRYIHTYERILKALYGDHVPGAAKMTDLDPEVQDAVQKNFHALTCLTCAESVDGQPGNSACQQCREEQ